MSKFTNPLSGIKIASPCSADWNEMSGDERSRFCGECKLNVYNLSEMSQSEAENLLLDSEGRLCLRFYKRADGTILTKDCPVGWQAIRQRVLRTATAFASVVFTALSGIGLANYFAQLNQQRTMATVTRIETSIPNETALEAENLNVAVQEVPIAKMGEVSVENTRIVGMLLNRTEVKQQLRKKRKR